MSNALHRRRFKNDILLLSRTAFKIAKNKKKNLVNYANRKWGQFTYRKKFQENKRFISLEYKRTYNLHTRVRATLWENPRFTPSSPRLREEFLSVLKAYACYLALISFRTHFIFWTYSFPRETRLFYVKSFDLEGPRKRERYEKMKWKKKKLYQFSPIPVEI